MRRRTFIAGLGSAAAWPVVARAQQPERVRRIGVLIGSQENDPLGKPRISAFTQAFADLGWTDGRNVRMDLRWAGPDINRIRVLAQELVGLQPDIILAGGTTVTAALQRECAIPSPVALSRGSIVRVGTAPASPARKPRWEASGLRCSRRSRPGLSGPQSCSIPTRSPHRLICHHLSRRPGHSRSRPSLRPFIAT